MPHVQGGGGLIVDGSNRADSGRLNSGDSEGDVVHSAESDARYESADYYKVEDLADWLHPWLEGRPFCAFSPKTLCPHTRRSMDMARALLCEDGWIEGFMYHRLTRVIPPGRGN